MYSTDTANFKHSISLFLCAILYSAFIIIHYRFSASNIALLAIFSILLIATMFGGMMVKLNLNSVSTFIVLFALYIFLLSLSSSSIEVALKYSSYSVLFFSPSIVNGIIRKRLTVKKQIVLLRGILIIWFVFAIVACAFYQNNYNAARRLASNEYYYGSIAIGGGYAFAYGTALLISHLLGMDIKSKTTLFGSRVVFMLFCFVMTLLIVLTKSTITLLAALLGSSVAMLGRRNRRKNSHTFKVVLVAFVIPFVFLFSYLTASNFIEKFSGSDSTLLIHFVDLCEFIFGDMSSADKTLLRFDLVQTSLKTFWENPLFGVGHRYGYNASLLGYNGIGNHSELVDTLAKYGILGTGLYFMIFYKAIENERKRNNGRLCNAYIVTFLLLIAFNPFNEIQGSFILLFVIPMLTDLSSRCAANDSATCISAISKHRIF